MREIKQRHSRNLAQDHTTSSGSTTAIASSHDRLIKLEAIRSSSPTPEDSQGFDRAGRISERIEFHQQRRLRDLARLEAIQSCFALRHRLGYLGGAQRVPRRNEKMLKRAALLLLCASVVVAQRADAAPSATWAVEGKITSVAITDKALETSGSTERVLEIAFSTSGDECGNSRAAGYVYQISSLVSNNVFEDYVKMAQTAYLSGRTLRYGTARRTSTSNCAPWFMQLK